MNPIEKYFRAEKNESILFLSVGAAALVVGIFFLMKLKRPFYTGMAYPLVAVALLQIVVGGAIFLRSPKDMARVHAMLSTNKASVGTEEIPRMEGVMRNFVVYRWVEIVLLALGLAAAAYFPALSFWKGVGVGLSIQAGLTLVLDFFAESRGKVYLDYLNAVVLG